MHIAEHAFAGEIRQRGHHATSSAAARAARKAVALLKVRSPKSAVFGGGILHFIGVQRHAARALLRKYCEEISRKNEQVTSRHIKGAASRCRPALRVQHYTLIAPQAAATHDERVAVSSCISRALSSLCGLRAHFTFLPCKAKTFRFCAEVMFA